jgi:hypothetical protein
LKGLRESIERQLVQRGFRILNHGKKTPLACVRAADLSSISGGETAHW